MKENPEEANVLADEVIRNTYRTLMTRGQKGCFVYCTDGALSDYLRDRLSKVYDYENETFFTDDWKVAEGEESYESEEKKF